MRRLPHRRRRLLLVRHARYEGVGAHRIVDHRLAQPCRKLDVRWLQRDSVNSPQLTRDSVTTSINFSGGQLILSAISLWNEDFTPNAYQTVLMFWAVMLICFSVNAFGARYLDFINKLCIVWTSASVVIILVTLLVMSKDRRSADFVFAHYDASASGW